MASVLLFAVIFFVVVAVAASMMAYVAWRGSKPSDFFVEAVTETYQCELSEAEINAYYDLKERMRKQKVPDAPEDDEAPETWIREVLSQEEQQERRVLQHALMKRLVSCFDRLDQVQRDKPGNWNLWKQKLISERYWASLLEAERLVSEEITSCVSEAGVLEPGWNNHIFNQAVHLWRQQKQQLAEKKEVKKDKEKQKKEIEKAEKRKEVEAKLAEEEKARQAKHAEPPRSLRGTCAEYESPSESGRGVGD
eukprot:g24021.t1